MGLDFDRIIVASHNEGKVREIRDLLRPYGLNVQSAAELGLPDVEETGATFIANAELKSIAAAKAAGLPALSDDSGLAVDALGGAPGIYSARWTEEDGGARNWALGMTRVQEAMEKSGRTETDAHFVCALSLAFPDGSARTYVGKVHGHIIWPARGNSGFGYDPIFLPQGFDQTFGEMDPDKKHAISHRADAFTQLICAEFDSRL
ncbi:RdgB/HAM1 family non-canonical purine NTP pyrophosphatase [Robiginitomaculum antarcticum]|uniref:RdgB/HAM1 family non-canonical purine NTP pyrophosphatase n=1 Tax=Robiginitomaculum antarcticum TaxID=437507 RepID=UPI00036DE5E2|nr:RdgB/HAM1 family non-canonical purine NTP pyrophosphatase [Robiginitomaculum antarcticum]